MRRLWLGKGRVRKGWQIQRDNEASGVASGRLWHLPTDPASHAAGAPLPLGSIVHLRWGTAGRGHVPRRWRSTVGLPRWQGQQVRPIRNRILGNRLQGEPPCCVRARGQLQELDRHPNVCHGLRNGLVQFQIN